MDCRVSLTSPDRDVLLDDIIRDFDLHDSTIVRLREIGKVRF